MTLAPWPEAPALRRLFLRDVVLDAQIGVDPHEIGVSQRVRINVSYGVQDEPGIGRDELGRTVSYAQVLKQLRAIIAGGHVRLVETLAERIAQAVLADARVRVVRVMVEKLDVFDELDSVGVEIERRA